MEGGKAQGTNHSYLDVVETNILILVGYFSECYRKVIVAKVR